MQAEGAEVELIGEGFPAGAAADMDRRFQTLQSRPRELPQKIRAESLEQISDVVVASAFVLIEEDLKENEVGYVQRATATPSQLSPSMHKAAVQAAWNILKQVCDDNLQTGIFLIFDVSLDDEFSAS